MVRAEGRIFFANAQQIGEQLWPLVDQARPRVVAFDCSALSDLEYTALKLFDEADQRLQREGVTLWLVALNPEVFAMVERSPLGERLGRERLIPTSSWPWRSTRRSSGRPSDGVPRTAPHARIGLRAAVLAQGTSFRTSLVLGVARRTRRTRSARSRRRRPGGGAMSMAAGEYVSVSSQADTEAADLERERGELATDTEREHDELAGIYEGRGLDPALAQQVATQLMAADAIGAHARDELGISGDDGAPDPGGVASAGTFARAPRCRCWSSWSSRAAMIPLVAGSSLAFLALLGGMAARAGGARTAVGALRVGFWGALAMALTAGVGALFGTVV
jgi:VIT1/CCC1 family predicted Fe2+/Mn2+ transporter/anti-anti-sigma regulatory factor